MFSRLYQSQRQTFFPKCKDQFSILLVKVFRAVQECKNVLDHEEGPFFNGFDHSLCDWDKLLEKLFSFYSHASWVAMRPWRLVNQPGWHFHRLARNALALAAFAAIFAVLAARAPALAAVAPVLAAVAAPRAKFTGTLEAPLRYTLIPST